MQLPRFLWVPFELGRPFGAPRESAFQRRVLLDALELVERTDGPVVLADFPDDAPAGDDDLPWSCPVSFAATAVEEPELVGSVRAEIAQLSPWAELGAPPKRNSGLAVDDMVDALRLIAGSADRAQSDAVDVQALRLIADDLRCWYLHAVAQQPGRAHSHDRNTWFWRETAVAHLLGHLTAELLVHPDPLVRMFASRGVVPRDHWDVLVPEPAQPEPSEEDTDD